MSLWYFLYFCEEYHYWKNMKRIFLYMMLMAASLGIGSCWVGYFNADEVRVALGLDENIVVTALLPLGYPADNAEPAVFHNEIRDLSDTVTEL